MEICGRDGRMLAARVEQKNGITKEDKNGVIPLTKKAPYKPDAGNPHVRFDERGRETGRCRMAQVTAPFLDSTNRPTLQSHAVWYRSFTSRHATRRCPRPLSPR